MGWRAASAAYAAGTYTGGLNEGTGGGFAEGFASTFAPAISQAADNFSQTIRDRRAEEREIRKEERQFQRQQDLLNLRSSLTRSSGAASRSRTANEEDEEAVGQISADVQRFLDAYDLPPTETNITRVASIISTQGTPTQIANEMERAIAEPGWDYTTPVQTPPSAPSTATPAAPAAAPSIAPLTSEFPDFGRADDLEATESSFNLSPSDLMPASLSFSPPAAQPAGGIDEPDPASANPVQAVRADFRGEAPTPSADLFAEPLSFGELPTMPPSPVTVAPEVTEETIESMTAGMTRAQIARVTALREMDTEELRRIMASPADEIEEQFAPLFYRTSVKESLMGMEDRELFVLAGRTDDPLIASEAERVLELRRRFETDPREIFRNISSVEDVEQRRNWVSNHLSLSMEQRKALLDGLDTAEQRMEGNVSPPQLGDVDADNWKSLEAQALAAEQDGLAEQIRNLGMDYEASSVSPERLEVLSQTAETLQPITRVITDTNNSVNTVIGMATTAERMMNLLAEEPLIMTTIGGRVPSALSALATELSALESTFLSGDPDDPVPELGFRQYQSQLERRATLPDNISGPAANFAMYRSLEAGLAFQIARAQQGPGGVISNQDFNNALEQVRASRNPETLERSLRNLVQVQYDSANLSLSDLQNNSAVEAARFLSESSGFPLRSLQAIDGTIEEKAEQAGAGSAVEWLRGNRTIVQMNQPAPQPVPQPAPEAPPSPEPTPTVTPPDTAIQMLLQNPTPLRMRQFEEAFGVPATNYLNTRGR